MRPAQCLVLVVGLAMGIVIGRAAGLWWHRAFDAVTDAVEYAARAELCGTECVAVVNRLHADLVGIRVELERCRGDR